MKFLLEQITLKCFHLKNKAVSNLIWKLIINGNHYKKWNWHLKVQIQDEVDWISLGKGMNLFSSKLWVNCKVDWVP